MGKVNKAAENMIQYINPLQDNNDKVAINLQNYLSGSLSKK